MSVTIVGAHGRPILYASMSGSDLQLEFETYASGAGTADIESITTIRRGQFKSIKKAYAVDPTLPILEALRQISDAGKGSEFKADVDAGRFGRTETFTWWSFDD